MKIAANSRARGRRGFTLIEMILAIGMAALVLVAVNAVLFTALHLRNSTQAVVDAAAPVDQAATFLRRDLACAVPPTNGTSKLLSGSFRVGSLNSAGIAEPVAIEMITASGALSDDAPWGDLQRVTYELKNPDNRLAPGMNLVRSVSRNLLAVSTPDVTDQLLLTGVSSLKFSCYDGSQWDDTWDTSNPTATYTNLPLAVRVDIQMAGGLAAGPPIELVVPLDAVARTNRVLQTTGG